MFRLLFWTVLIGALVFGYYEMNVNDKINDGVQSGRQLITQTAASIKATDAYQSAVHNLGVATGKDSL